MAQTPPEFHGLSLHITVTVAPENVSKFLDLLRPVYEAVVAEPECTFFEVFTSSDKPGVLHWVQGRSKDWEWFLEVQLQKEYYKPYFAATEPLITKSRELQIFYRLPPGWAKAKPEHFAKE